MHHPLPKKNTFIPKTLSRLVPKVLFIRIYNKLLQTHFEGWLQFLHCALFGFLTISKVSMIWP